MDLDARHDACQIQPGRRRAVERFEEFAQVGAVFQCDHSAVVLACDGANHLMFLHLFHNLIIRKLLCANEIAEVTRPMNRFPILRALSPFTPKPL